MKMHTISEASFFLFFSLSLFPRLDGFFYPCSLALLSLSLLFFSSFPPFIFCSLQTFFFFFLLDPSKKSIRWTVIVLLFSFFFFCACVLLF